MSGPDYPPWQQNPSRQPAPGFRPPPARPPQPPYPHRATNYPGPQPQSPPGYPVQWPPRQGQYPQYAWQPAPYSTPRPSGQTPSGPQRQKRSRRWLPIAGTVVVVLVAAALVALGPWKLSFFKNLLNHNTLDVNKAQTGVQQILTDPIKGYGTKNVTDVKCNNGQNPLARMGDNFTCEVKIDGAQRRVTVVFADDNGTYEVDRPK